MRTRTAIALVATTAAAGVTGLALAQPAYADVTVHPAAAYTCEVDANNVNYRTGPGVKYPSLGQVNKGFLFQSNGLHQPSNPNDEWETYIRSGRPTAYIAARYVAWCSPN
ncbi:hypothetical protein [Actinocatenispora rupis]|uniref:SH3 domain-containing protein n=1 Tax=Actinocatenispora rupis TaxID=519421 RepID=A0A8J3JET9_9ACTN|nr:hypothetical protein [Actinocatenispora rupis]GID15384.1 hypothetical protein Aru02nite_62730 [Actinocatenispora rupis]